MAHIREFRGRWRAQVERGGVRRSMVCDTHEEAQAWAKSVEATLKARNRARSLCRSDVHSDVKLLTAVPTKVLKALSEIPYDAETIISASVPCNSRSGIYFLIVGNSVKYVGQSIDVLKRISRHIQDGRKFDSFSFINCPVDSMDALEATYITALLPEWNLSLGNRLM